MNDPPKMVHRSTENTLADLIIDTAMLSNSDYDKEIPNLLAMNKLLQKEMFLVLENWNLLKLIRKNMKG